MTLENVTAFLTYFYFIFFCISMFYAQPDSVVEAAVEKINSLLESFMGINDADLGNNSLIWLKSQ